MSSTTIVDEIKNFYNTSQARSELEDMLAIKSSIQKK